MYSAGDVASSKVFCHFFAVIHPSLGLQQVTFLLLVMTREAMSTAAAHSSVLEEDSVTDTDLLACRNWAGCLCRLLCRSGENCEL